MASEVCPKCGKKAETIHWYARGKDGKRTGIAFHKTRMVKIAGIAFRDVQESCYLEQD